MPELPEVQTVVNDLQVIVNDTITDFWSDWSKALKDSEGKYIELTDFARQVKNKKILSIERFGKNIFLKLSGDLSLFIHLRMTGQLLIDKRRTKSDDKEKYSKHIHHIFSLKKHGSLMFSDIRKFATLKLLPTSQVEEIKAVSGIDPFDKNFTFNKFCLLLEKRKTKNIKEFLLNQAEIIGIGNIYASEILFDAKINPSRITGSLKTSEKEKLFLSIKKILKLAIKLRGTSVSDYRDSAGQKGAFQNMLKVYRKQKQKCSICGTIIIRTVIGQRSTFHCPKCQK